MHLLAIFLLLISSGFCSDSLADTIILKSGKNIDGKITEKTDEKITMDVQGVPVTYFAEEVQEIQEDSKETSSADNPQPVSDKKDSDVSQTKTGDASTTDAPTGTIDIPINPLLKLDGLSRDAIYKMRQKYVLQVPGLAPVSYQPNKDVFGRIEDGKPWWGLLGMSYYGNGERSVEGNSKESRFIANPYLLVGIEEPLAWRLTGSSLEPKEIYPKPTQLVWEAGKAWGQVIYDVHDYYDDTVQYKYKNLKELYFSDYNARDFGFNYFAIDSKSSNNITGSMDKIIPIIQFIHTGGSCGYPGGCNNKSPTQADLLIKWTDLPARIYLKLWRKQAADPSEKSDMDFIIDLN